jgi:hypothetical protein
MHNRALWSRLRYPEWLALAQKDVSNLQCNLRKTHDNEFAFCNMYPLVAPARLP